MTDSFTEEISPFMTQKFFPPRALAILISTRSTSEAFTAESAAIKIDGDVSVSIDVYKRQFLFPVLSFSKTYYKPAASKAAGIKI